MLYKSDERMHLNSKAMEESNGEIVESHELKTRPEVARITDSLTTKTADLERAREDLRQAKEDATQSWLDSRPLIDELEKMQAGLDGTRARVLEAKTKIVHLQAQLEDIENRIKSAKDEDQTLRVAINEKNQDVHRMQEDMQQLKKKIDKKRRRRSKLKLVIRLKRQTLEALELTSAAMKLDSEAFATSAAQALYYINNSGATNVLIEMTREEYDSLKREGNERISQAEYQILESQEERAAAENSRDLAFRRLQSLHTPNRLRQTNTRGKTIHYEGMYTRDGGSSKGREELPSKVKMQNPQQQSRNKVIRKESIFFRIKTFIVRSLKKYFN